MISSDQIQKAKFKAMEHFTITSTLDVEADGLDISINVSGIPRELVACIEDLDKVIIKVDTNFKNKLVLDEEDLKNISGTYRLQRPLYFKKKEWVTYTNTLSSHPTFPKKFLEQVKVELEEIFDRFNEEFKLLISHLKDK